MFSPPSVEQPLKTHRPLPINPRLIAMPQSSLLMFDLSRQCLELPLFLEAKISLRTARSPPALKSHQQQRRSSEWINRCWSGYIERKKNISRELRIYSSSVENRRHSTIHQKSPILRKERLPNQDIYELCYSNSASHLSDLTHACM